MVTLYNNTLHNDRKRKGLFSKTIKLVTKEKIDYDLNVQHSKIHKQKH